MLVVFSYAKMSDDIEKKDKGDILKTVVIIGGGAAGMVAAIAAARNGATVTLLEHMDRIGKKILSTGNGKCNYTNRNQNPSCYRGEHSSFVTDVFTQFGQEDTVVFFRELGIYPKEKNGYFYPASEQAASILDVLRMELVRLKVHIVTECQILKVEKKKKGFLITGNNNSFFADACIFSCGLKAFPKSGSDGSALPYIEQLSHRIVDVVPALVQLKAKSSFFKFLAGIRAEICLNLYVENNLICSERGEVQLTDYGISGIPTFQISRFASNALVQKKKVMVSMDFLPDLSFNETKRELLFSLVEHSKDKTCEEALIGMFQKKLIPVLLKECGISPSQKAAKLPLRKVTELAGLLKEFQIEITGTKGFESAQVCAGGVDTNEINPKTLESRLNPDLYFAGEVIDIDGICGGYNLQWAWSSGYVAGTNSARKQGGDS